MPEPSDIPDAAAQWLIRLEGQASAQIWAAFEGWMDGDPRHRAAFIRLRVAWNRADMLKSMRPLDGTIDADLLEATRITPTLPARGVRAPQGKSRRRPDSLVMPSRRRAIAAVAAIAATGVFAWFGAYHLGWKSFETGIGGREKIELADGSTVDLNTNTALDARISGGRRDIMLTRGEALFHVAHDPARPFYVTAGGAVVRAVGTAFCVRIRDAGHIDVIVEEGRVAVGAPGAEANFENPSLLATAPKVSAGEAASVRQRSVEVRALPRQDMMRKLAWTAGHLAFRGETLEDAVQEFNRYNQRQIAIADPSILKVQVGGIFSTTDPDSFIAALQRSFGFRVQPGNEGDLRLFSGGAPP